ncbi:MAG: prepilin-type N-terminal cleavage/methylation domain-containing protein [Glaciimonas sp.]|nr:prepilin-type N-terminal cleavage/methylation domain-containing protein [Glaciimonas sp.]
MRRVQSGFTLMELVVVITILSILAAIALPKFAALQTEARIAKMNSTLGSIKIAAVLAHSVQLTQQLTLDTDITMEGSVIAMTNGYPTTALASIGTAAGLANGTVAIAGFVPVATSATVFTVTPDVMHANCAVTYTPSAVVGTSPTYDNAGLTAANCQ